MILVTGFEGYGGRSDNPSAALVAELDNSEIEGVAIHSRLLPVDLVKVRDIIPDLLASLKPEVVISFGLWPGEPVVRIERLAVNCADFELTDNAGLLAREPIVDGQQAAYFSTLPIDKIERALRDDGIPARLSNSAGSYLCNALMYTVLHECAKNHPKMRAGFLHLPYLPAQVAQLFDQIEEERVLEQHQRSDYASMELKTMVRAARTALRLSLKEQIS